MKNKLLISLSLLSYALSAMEGNCIIKSDQELPEYYGNAIPPIIHQLHQTYFNFDQNERLYHENLPRFTHQCCSLSQVNKTFNTYVPMALAHEFKKDARITLSVIASLRILSISPSSNNIFLSVAKNLLNNGTDPDARKSVLYPTPLVDAVKYGDVKYAKTLLKYGANPFLLHLRVPGLTEEEKNNFTNQYPNNTTYDVTTKQTSSSYWEDNFKGNAFTLAKDSNENNQWLLDLQELKHGKDIALFLQNEPTSK